MPSHYLPIHRTRGFRGDLTASPDPFAKLFSLRSVPFLYHHTPALASAILRFTQKNLIPPPRRAPTLLNRYDSISQNRNFFGKSVQDEKADHRST